MGRHGSGFERICEVARSKITEIAVDTLLDQLPDPSWTVIDVREDREWAEGRIPGSLHLGRGVLERDIEATIPDPSTPIVLYCGGGYRSALAAVSLQEMGYRMVRSLAGGRRAWQAANGPWDTTPT